jgi:tRNA threonylcarbamoyladenosine biosynthesis protein TsaE
MKQIIKFKDLSELPKAAKNFLNITKNCRKIAFYGELGAGKTTFIKALCTQLNVKDQVSSPSFSIINEYHTIDDEILYHMDFYRIDGIEEVLDLGYEEYFYDPNYCFIEWPEQIEPILPDFVLRVKLSVDRSKNRILEIDFT